MTHTSVDTNLHGPWSPRQVALPHVHPLCLSLSASLSVLASFARSFHLRGSLIGHSACIIPDEEYCACIHEHSPSSDRRTVSTDKKEEDVGGEGHEETDRHIHSVSLSLSLSLHSVQHSHTHALVHSYTPMKAEVINNQQLGWWYHKIEISQEHTHEGKERGTEKRRQQKQNLTHSRSLR